MGLNFRWGFGKGYLYGRDGMGWALAWRFLGLWLVWDMGSAWCGFAWAVLAGWVG